MIQQKKELTVAPIPEKSHHEKLLQEIFLIWRHGYTEGLKTNTKPYDFRKKEVREMLQNGIFSEVLHVIENLYEEKYETKKAQADSIQKNTEKLEKD